MHEFDSVKRGSFLTLTYSDEFLPSKGSLVKAHLQGFIKRMRNKDVFKYYGVGEYGDNTNRPHYHVIIIGDDSSAAGSWNFGFIDSGSVTWDSINYVTSYIQKKLYGPLGKKEYGERLPPFALMSKGMGLGWLENDYNYEQVMLHLGVRRHGKVVRAPRYYFKKMKYMEKYIDEFGIFERKVDVIPVDVWNARSIMKSAENDDENLEPLERSEKDRESRRQKEADLVWKKHNASSKGSI